MTRAAEIRSQATGLVGALSTEQLVEMFELSDAAPMTEEVARVRGWIIDEMDTRGQLALLGIEVD